MQGWLDTLTFWHWFILGALLLTGETIGVARFLAGAGLAAVLVGLVLITGPAFAWPTQVFLFATFAVVFTLMQRKRSQALAQSASSTHIQDTAHLIGQTFVLDHSLPLGRGVLRVNGQTWHVHSAESLAPGQRIKVIGMEGSVLNVIPLRE
jgi:inner membrane protein